MISVLLLATVISPVALRCPAPRIVKQFGNTLTDKEAEIFRGAQKRCRQKYKDSPCLTEFRVKGDNNYQVLCGGLIYDR